MFTERSKQGKGSRTGFMNFISAVLNPQREEGSLMPYGLPDGQQTSGGETRYVQGALPGSQRPGCSPRSTSKVQQASDGPGVMAGTAQPLRAPLCGCVDCTCLDRLSAHRECGRVSFGYSLMRGKRQNMEDFHHAQVPSGSGPATAHTGRAQGRVLRPQRAGTQCLCTLITQCCCSAFSVQAGPQDRANHRLVWRIRWYVPVADPCWHTALPPCQQHSAAAAQ